MASRAVTERVARSAIFSADRRYRYALVRAWNRDAPRAVFVGLNPSTADEREDDPTIRRCVGYARLWKCGSMAIVNLFAFCSTEPKGLGLVADPVGPENTTRLRSHLDGAPRAIVVAAWGRVPATVRRLARETIAELEARRGIRVLGLNRDGSPKHPLYLAYDRPLTTWRAAIERARRVSALGIAKSDRGAGQGR
jgi:hypothetical protein